MSRCSVANLCDLWPCFRTAIGAHGGSYSIYHALAVAIQDLKIDHKPDFTNTEPAATIGPFPQWSDPKKIVAMDPLGHLAPWLYNDYINKDNVEIRPTIAITKAHMKLPELENSVKAGRLQVDGKICLNESGELAVTKFAVEPVWYLPGVAERFGIGMSNSRCTALPSYELPDLGLSVPPTWALKLVFFFPLLVFFPHATFHGLLRQKSRALH